MGALCASAQTEPDTTDATDRYTTVLRNVPLDEALQRFVEITEADLGYANALVEDRYTYCRIRDATTEQLLQCILESADVDYVRTSDGSYVLVAAFQAPDAEGRLTGTVVDAETGMPLPDANVLLADASAGRATNEAGRFHFSPILAGEHQVVVTYVGYESEVKRVWVPQDGQERVRIALNPAPLTAPPLVINGLERRLPSFRLGTNTTDREALERVEGPGTPDVAHAVRRQPGVALGHPRADLHVQGGDIGEHATLLDGVPIREPVTLGGLVSAFSPDALRRVQVHKAGFGAQHGSYTAGVIAAEHDLARPRTNYAQVSADPVSINARAEASWSAGDTASGRVMGAVRTSVWDIYRSPALHHRLATWTRPDPTLTMQWDPASVENTTGLAQRSSADAQFSDIHLAAQQELTPFHQIYASVYRGHTRMQTDVNNTGASLDAATPLASANQTRLLATHGRTGWTNTMAQIRHDWSVTDRVASRVRVHTSHHESHSLFEMRDSLIQQTDMPPQPNTPTRVRLDAADHALEENELNEWGGKASVDVSLSPRYRLNASVAPRYMQSTVHIRNRFLGAFEHHTRAWHLEGHAEGEASLGLGTTLTAGTRLTYLSNRQMVYAEPRVALRYDRSTTPLGDVALRVAGGLYRQYVTQAEISNDGPMAVVPSVRFWLPIGASVAPPRAYHATADALVMPTDAWSFRLETYYKAQPRTLEVDYARLVHAMPLSDMQAVATTQTNRQDRMLAAGRARAYGASLRVQRNGTRVDAEVVAEMGRSRRQYPGRFNDRLVPASWEQPVRLDADLGVALGRGMEARVSGQGVWGRSWALRRAYYDYIANIEGSDTFEGFDLNRPGDQQLAPMLRLDLALRGTWTLRGMGLRMQIGLVNALDRKNPFDWSLDTSGAVPEPAPRNLPGRRAFVLVGIRY
ncbi:TonB-dependent receptor [Longimonas halophila]|uniref:TonB-dependent receptor n=1 Tax=Longimonas halophila TaxID=1469170 RepID=UPI001596DB37|nr:TonB-dependent receptor [Longimonas halophila]